MTIEFSDTAYSAPESFGVPIPVPDDFADGGFISSLVIVTVISQTTVNQPASFFNPCITIDSFFLFRTSDLTAEG